MKVLFLLSLFFYYCNCYDYSTLYYDQMVDHFGFMNNNTYKQRFLINDQKWKNPGGPIFFYTGNEGDIEMFCNNTGFMWDIAAEYNAMVVFAEHRYYGKSMPFGADSFKNTTTLDPFTAEQALADFVTLLNYIKTVLVAGAENSPVVAFGGSYGGMLSAWMRIKYPHVIVGAIAASAPIWQFTGLTPCETYNNITTGVFRSSGKDCAESIRASWAAMDRIGSTESGKQFLSSTFRLCKPLKDTSQLKAWLTEAWGDVVMVNYPYPANFLAPLPAWPIKAICTHLTNSSLSDRDLIIQIYQAVSVFMNYTGQARCNDINQDATPDLGTMGWDYQSCTEMVMPMCANGKDDMFEPFKWDLSAVIKQCQKKWGVTPRPYWIEEYYGGKNIAAASNIVFSNGDLDPWSGGGVLSSITDLLPAVLIPGSAHHEDLRSADPRDLPQVQQARNVHRAHITKWIQQEQQRLIQL